MATFVRIDDGVLRSLLFAEELYTEFPKFASLKQKLNKTTTNKGCRCRRSVNSGTSILMEAKAYIQTLSKEKKARLKQFLKADYIQMMVTESNGRHKDYTW